ncbi:MAG TPA: sigma 54-interacting transcriptional regulator [Myxococcaceae bacterium]|nr:sigma 54-interacting transcriptional regulator [Myxococcaceae bacterium]
MPPVLQTRDTVSTTPALIHSDDSPLGPVLRTCLKIARSDATVLITGETGTGKEVLARTIHSASERGDGPLVPVNCGAIPDALLESELFGHVRGAFTGAHQARRGRLALAHGGTLFLDEIGELPLHLQVKLLRVLQERAYEPVGSAESVPADFRLIAATNRDLAAEVEAGRFRRDLYYRLLVCPVELPPLRARPADIPVLLEHFWRNRGETRPLHPAAVAQLTTYAWPGNVRELENLVERISVCTEGPIILPAHLPPHLRGSAPPAQGRAAEPATLAAVTPIRPEPVEPPSTPEPIAALAALPDVRTLPLPIDVPLLLRQLEDAFIEAALRQSAGNKKAAADLLGLQRTTLVEKLRRRNRDASIA